MPNPPAKPHQTASNLWWRRIRQFALIGALISATMVTGVAIALRYWLWPGFVDLIHNPVLLQQASQPYLQGTGLSLEVTDARADWSQWHSPSISVGRIRLIRADSGVAPLVMENLSAHFGLRSLLSPIYGLPLFSRLSISSLDLHGWRDDHGQIWLGGFLASRPHTEDAEPRSELLEAISRQGPLLIEQSLLRWQDHLGPQPGQGQILLDDLQLHISSDDLLIETLGASALELSQLVSRVIPTPQIQGQLGPLRIDWSGPVAKAMTLDPLKWVDMTRLDIQFQNLGMQQALKSAPGLEVSGLSGRLLMSPKGASLAISSQDLVVTAPEIFPQESITLDQFSGLFDFSPHAMVAALTSHASSPASTLSIRFEQIAARQGEFKLQASGSYNYSPQGLGSLQTNGTIGGFSPRKLTEFLPLGMSKQTRQWLIDAIQSGRPVSGDFTLNGKLEEFPFQDPVQGDFLVRLRLEDQTLQFSPDWPKISGAFIDLRFERSRMSVESRQAMIGAAPIRQVSAVIADLTDPEASLEIRGQVAGGLAQMLDVVNASPVSGWLDQALVASRAQGLAELNLEIKLPLGQTGSPQAAGHLSFKDNRVSLDPDIPELSAVKGSLWFTQEGLTKVDITGRTLGGPFSGVSTPLSKSPSRLMVKGEFAATSLEAWLRQSAGIPFVAGVLTGRSPYALQIDLGPAGISAKGQSSLKGLAIKLPAPAAKSAGEDWGLQLAFSQRGLPKGGRQQNWRIDSIANRFTADVQKILRTDNAVAKHATQGRIGIGVAAATPSREGILMQVQAESFDVSAWMDAFGRQFADLNKASAPADKTVALSRIELDARQVLFGGQVFSAVKAQAAQQSGSWRVDLQSAQAAGQLAWTPYRKTTTDPVQSSSGTLVARLSRLWLPPGQLSEQSAGSNVLEAEISPPTMTSLAEARRWPTLDLVAEDFRRGSRNFGRLVLDAAPATDQPRWDIKSLTIENPSARLTAKGQWAAQDTRQPLGPSITQLDLQLKIEDGAALLARMGHAGLIRRTPGEMSGRIQWAGSPADFQLSRLEGGLSLDLKNGQFLKADAGLAKLISVVNLQSLPKRITLDFRDIFSEGFIYERVRGNVQFSKGQAQTENLRIVGIQASVFLEGNANLMQETQNLRVLVLPEVNAGLASLGYALVNPAVGLGSFLAQYILRDPLRQALAYEYQITGAWTDPQVKALPRRPIEPATIDGPTTPTR